MTVQELIDWCAANNVPLDTHIAVRAKDDFLLTEDGVAHDQAYFGNCRAGMKWERENGPRVDGDIDYENMPKVLILDSGRY